MIYGILGRQRSGKGVIGCEVAHEHWLDGHRIISNTPFYFTDDENKPTYERLDLDILETAVYSNKSMAQIYSTPKVALFLDELMLLMDSRASLSKDNRLLSYLASQSAKLDTPIIYTSQEKDAVDLRIRRFAGYYFVTEKISATVPEIVNGRPKNVQYILGFDVHIIDNQGIEPRYQTSFSLKPDQARFYMRKFRTEEKVTPKAKT